jgi:hypothetical protein
MVLAAGRVVALAERRDRALAEREDDGGPEDLDEDVRAATATDWK